MQASLPKFVDAVKVDDLSQGKNPLRIISMRGLPDRMDNPKHPQEEWITGGKATEDKSLNEDDNAGDYLNLEVALSYQAQPGQGSESKLRENNMHLSASSSLWACADRDSDRVCVVPLRASS